MAEEKIFYCVGCGKVHNKSDFYVSYSKAHANGRLPYCKSFIKKEIYTNDKDVDLKKLHSMLMQLNIPFLKDTFDTAISSNGDIVGHYFRLFNSLPQNRGLTWSNSVFFNDGEDEKKDDIQDNKVDVKSKKNEKLHFNNDLSVAKQRWGINYSDTQLEELERFYIKMEESNNIETPQDKIYLEKLSLISLKMNEELESGNYAQVKQLGDLFSKYMADSKFRAVDKTDADRQGGIRTFGSIYAEVEKDGHIPPWEHYRKIKGLSQDILDKTIMHIENFTLRFNKAETMSSPPIDTPKAEMDEIDENATEGGDYGG